MPTKKCTIYELVDSRGPDGQVYKADGPAIREAIREGSITENDTWDFTEEQLLDNLRAQAAI